DRKSRGVRSLFLAILNCFVRDKPRVAAATQIASTRMPPPRDVTFVLIGNSDSNPVQFDTPGLGEMKNVFMTVVEEPLRTDRFEMTVRSNFSFSILDANRFDPVNDVLENKYVSQLHNELVRQHRSRRR